jgi:glutamine cyclotransferase
MSHDSNEISVTVDVSGHELDKQQQRVVDMYEQNIETFIRKNEDYGGSFENTAKVESILKHGEVREDSMPEIVSRQIFVRGFMDKVSRFYQLAFEQDDAFVNDESVIDTLLDLGNYAIMLASLLESYESDSDQDTA